ncbi:hypothetical protein VWM68_11205, partial [Campylobacter coli]
VSIHERSLLNVLSGSVIRIPNYTNNKADDITLPAPSLAQLTKGQILMPDGGYVHLDRALNWDEI